MQQHLRSAGDGADRHGRLRRRHPQISPPPSGSAADHGRRLRQAREAGPGPSRSSQRPQPGRPRGAGGSPGHARGAARVEVDGCRQANTASRGARPRARRPACRSPMRWPNAPAGRQPRRWGRRSRSRSWSSTARAGSSAVPAAGELRRVLILGGTAEARALAEAILVAGVAMPVTALAGVTEAPLRPPGEVRIGGFGGAAGLAGYLACRALSGARSTPRIPSRFRSAGMPARRPRPPAFRGSGSSGRPGRPGLPTTGSAAPISTRRWQLLPDACPTGASRLSAVAACPGSAPVRRSASSSAGSSRRTTVPANVLWLQGRPPFDVEDETALLEQHRIEALLVRESGGASGWPKLLAARALSLPVLMLRRPEPVPGPTVAQADEAVAWLRELLARL